MDYEVEITASEIKQCVAFASLFSEREAEKSVREFGSVVVKKRNPADIKADTFTGKVAEVAVQKFLSNFGIHYSVDFDVNAGYKNIDGGQDINSINAQPNNIKCDVKGTKKNAQWLLIEKHKIDADVFIIAKLDTAIDPRVNFAHFDKLSTLNVNIAGFALKNDFIDHNYKYWFAFREKRQLVHSEKIQSLISDTRSVYPNKELNREDLKYCYRQAPGNYTTYIGPELKAKVNLGMPISTLRKSKQEFQQLAEGLKSQSLNSSYWTSII